MKAALSAHAGEPRASLSGLRLSLESATLEAARSSTRGSGWAPCGPDLPLLGGGVEPPRAARRAPRHILRVQGPSSDTARALSSDLPGVPSVLSFSNIAASVTFQNRVKVRVRC